MRWMQRIPIQSSVLLAVAYDPADRLFEAEFHNGQVYQYHRVPPELYQQLLAAESLGSFFNRKIRNHFPCRPIAARSA